jgi:hypothetical protein
VELFKVATANARGGQYFGKVTLQFFLAHIHGYLKIFWCFECRNKGLGEFNAGSGSAM